MQQSQTDSLKSVVKQTDNDSIKASGFYNLSRIYYPYDQDSAILFATSAKEISNAKNFKKLEANALNIIGVSFLIKAEYEKALSTHFEALGIRETLQDTVGMIESTMNLGNIYYRLGEPEKAVAQYHEALALAQQINHERAMSLLYNNLGSFYRDRWLAFKDENDFNQAKDFLQKSLDIKEKLQDNRGIINTLGQLGELYYESGEKIKGIEMVEKSLEYSEELNDTEGRLSSLGTLSDYYRDEQDISKSLPYAKEAYELAESTDSYYHIAIAASRMANLSALNKDFENAYQYLLVHRASNDSVFNGSRQKIRDELEIQYESEKKELENQKLTQDQALAELSLTRKNELLWIFISVGLLLLALAWHQRKINQKLRIAHRKLEETNQKVQNQNKKIQEQAAELKNSNRELKKANKFREKLFSIISHDLRTPFASLNNSLDLWQEGELSMNEMNYILSNIASNTRSASILLSNLLTWARTQMSSEQVEKTEVSPAELISENQQLFAKQLDQKELTLHNNIPSGVSLHTDRDRLRFILRNIISNALKFTPAGGEITASLDPDCPSAILIKDSGIGMSQAQIDTLFNKKQYSSTGTNGEQGTGIGLMLCKDFADSIGAKITVSSQAGRSTTFRVEI
jgi:signal transduction histidine kinase